METVSCSWRASVVDFVDLVSCERAEVLGARRKEIPRYAEVVVVSVLVRIEDAQVWMQPQVVYEARSAALSNSKDSEVESELVWRIRGWKWQNGTVANVGRWREETVAILRELGDGDILAAAGREVWAENKKY